MCNKKPSNPRAEDGYCNEAIQSRPSTHSQTCQTQNISKNTEVKQRVAWTREEIREVIYDAICIAESISQTTIRRCMKYEDKEIQTVGCTWIQRNSQARKKLP